MSDNLFKIVFDSQLTKNHRVVSGSLDHCKDHVIRNNVPGFSRQKNTENLNNGECSIDLGNQNMKNSLKKSIDYNYYINTKYNSDARYPSDKRIIFKFPGITPYIYSKEYLEPVEDVYIFGEIPTYEVVGTLKETAIASTRTSHYALGVRRRFSEDDPKGKTVFFQNTRNQLKWLNPDIFIKYRSQGDPEIKNKKRIDIISENPDLHKWEKNENFDTYIFIIDIEDGFDNFFYWIGSKQNWKNEMTEIINNELNSRGSHLEKLNQKIEIINDKILNYQKMTQTKTPITFCLKMMIQSENLNVMFVNEIDETVTFYNLIDINDLSNYLEDKKGGVLYIKKNIKESYSALESLREGEDLSEQFRRKKQEEKQEEKSRSIYYLVFILVVLLLTISFFIVKKMSNKK